jgi:hypothetical protein
MLFCLYGPLCVFKKVSTLKKWRQIANQDQEVAGDGRTRASRGQAGTGIIVN